MNSERVSKDYIHVLQNIYEVLEGKSKGLIENQEYLLNLKNEMDDIPRQLKGMKKEGRNLKIGIVGEVKAGKSSFLNALVFKGDEVLPKAATPMTAALTRIKYSEEEYVEVEFFKDYDWKEIENGADLCDKRVEKLKGEELNNSSDRYLPEANTHNKQENNSERQEIKSKTYKDYAQHIESGIYYSKELTEMVQNSGINPHDFLGKTQKIKKSELNNYVGSKGKYTPLVKYTELHLNNPLIKGMEIIDTPGLNDPILSRGQKTKDFLKNCDVVFVLSYVGQFLGNEDIEFIRTTLPAEGVQKAIIIGSKFDSGLLDYKERKSTFEKALRKSFSNYISQTKQTFKKLQENSADFTILKDLQKSLDNGESPIFISSLLYNCAKKKEKKQPLSEEEENIINQMKRRFSGFKETPEFLLELANVDSIEKNVFNDIKEKKEIILANKINEFSKSEKAKLNKILEDINIQSLKLSNELNDYDLDQSKRKYRELNNHLNSLREKIKYRFERSAIEIEQNVRRLKHNIFDEKANVRLKKQNTTRTDTRIEKSGFLGLIKKTKEFKIHEVTASVTDVVENIRNSIGLINRKVDEEFENIFDTDLLIRQIKEITISKLDLSSKNFNEADILEPINNHFLRLKLPNFEMTSKKYEDFLYQELALIKTDDLSVTFTGERVHNLEHVQSDVLQKISNDSNQKLNELGKEIQNKLNEMAGSFVDDIENRLSDFQSNLKNLIENKEENLVKFEEYQDLISKSKQQLKSMVINNDNVG